MITNNTVNLNDNNIFGCLVCIKVLNTNTTKSTNNSELYLSHHKSNGLSLITLETLNANLSSNSIQYTANTTILWDIFPDDVSQLKHDFIPEFLERDDILDTVFA